MTSFHATPWGHAWRVRRGGSKRTRAVRLSETEAWCEACRLARGVGGTAFLYDKDGRIVAREFYGEAE